MGDSRPDPVASFVARTKSFDPNSLQKALFAALRGPDGAKMKRAMSRDPRLAPVLLRIAKDPVALGKLPLVIGPLVAQRHAPAVPILVELLRTASWTMASRIAKAILATKDEALLERLASTLPVTKAGTEAFSAHKALARRGGEVGLPKRLYERLAPMFALGPKERENVFRQLQGERKLVRAEPRFAERAIADALDPKSPARRLALLVVTCLPVEDQKALVARHAPPDTETGPRETALAKARAKMQTLRSALPSGTFVPARPSHARELATLEAITGPLPAMVRAVYETFDTIDAPTAKGRDRVVLLPLREGLREAKAWRAKHGKKPAAVRPLLAFPIAPDRFERNGTSGGPPCHVELPSEDADPRIQYMAGTPRLSSYLTRAKR